MKRLHELEDEIAIISNFQPQKADAVDLGSLVEADVDGEERKLFFLLPAASGEKVYSNGKEIFIVTPSSPLGQRLKGKKVGDYFDLPVGSKTHEYEILSIY